MKLRWLLCRASQRAITQEKLFPVIVKYDQQLLEKEETRQSTLNYFFIFRS